MFEWLFQLNLSFNNILKPQTIWESKLDARVATKPTIVTNHVTQDKEIIVQDELSNLYNIDEIAALLSPDSNFLHRGLVDVAEDKNEADESWKNMLLVVPSAPQNVLSELNKKFKFKRFEIIQPADDCNQLFLPEPSDAHIERLINQYQAEDEKFKQIPQWVKAGWKTQNVLERAWKEG